MQRPRPGKRRFTSRALRQVTERTEPHASCNLDEKRLVQNAHGPARPEGRWMIVQAIERIAACRSRDAAELRPIEMAVVCLSEVDAQIIGANHRSVAQTTCARTTVGRQMTRFWFRRRLAIARAVLAARTAGRGCVSRVSSQLQHPHTFQWARQQRNNQQRAENERAIHTNDFRTWRSQVKVGSASGGCRTRLAVVIASRKTSIGVLGDFS